MTVYADDFNRANAALTTPWVNLEGVHSVSSNKVVVGTISPTVSYYNQTFTADQWAEADIVYVPGNGSTISVAVRVNGSDLYYLWINGSAHVTISKRVSGSYSDAGTATATVAAGFKARLEVQGTTLRAYADGVLVVTVTGDASIATGRTGIISATAGAATLDNYRCGDGAYVPAGGTTPVTPATRATTWVTKALVTNTRATTWNVAGNLTQVTASRATTWVTKARITPTRATTWNVAATGGGGGNIGIRTFNGVADTVTLNMGNIGGASSLDCWIWGGRLLNESADGEIISTTSYDPLDYFYATGNGPHLQLYDGATDSLDLAGKPSLRVSDGFVICAVRRVAGAPCRWSKAVYATTWGAFVHSDQPAVVFGNRTYSAADVLRLCTAAPLNIDLALMARTTSSSDADIATLTTNLDAWKALPNLTNLWRFDGATVVDLKGTATQSAIVGTTTTAGAFPLADSTGGGTTPVSASRATTWNVAGTLTRVTTTRATTWNVAGTLTKVTATRATTWTVFGPLGYFADEFTGSTLDLGLWDVYNRLGDQDNQEVNAVIPANVRVTGGSLFIDSKFEDVVAGDSTTGPPNPRTVHYTSAQIASKNTFLYGRVDVRAKIPGGIGLWPCLWMLDYTQQPHQPNSADEPGSISHYAEIDFAEFMGNQRTTVNCQIHVNKGGGQVDPGGFVGLAYDATTRFIVYRLDWTAGSAIFSVNYEDGTGFHVIQTITGAANVPDVPMYLILMTAVGGNGGGTPNPATFPQSMEIDYARVSPPVTSVAPATRATTWTVAAPLTRITATRATSWTVLGVVTAASRSTSWAAFQLITSSRGTTWNVAGSLSFVQSTRAASWAVNATLTSSRPTSWSVLVGASSVRSTTWSVLVPVTASRPTTWALNASVGASRSTTWAIAGVVFFVSATRATTWAVRIRASSSRSTTWRTAPAAPQSSWLVLYPDTVMYKGTHRVLALYQGDTKVWP